MSRILSGAACAVVVASILGPRALATEPRRGLEHAVAEDALVYGSVDVERLLVAGKSLHLAQLWNDEEIQEFLAPVLGPVGSTGSVRIANALATLTHGYGLPDVIAGRVSFAICGTGMIGADGKPTWFDAAHPPSAATPVEPGTLLFPDLVLTVESSGRAACEASIARVLELEPDIASTPTTIAGFAATESVIPMIVAKDGSAGRSVSLFHGFSGDLFVATTRSERFEQIMRSAQQTPEVPQKPLASFASFQTYRNEIVREGAVAELFVNVPIVLSTMLPIAAAFELEVGAVVPAMQGAGARGFGMAIAFEDGRIRQSIGLLVTSSSMVGSMARMFARPGILERASGIEGNMLALSIGVDWEAVLNAVAMDTSNGIDAALGQASTKLGVDIRTDVLPALGDTITLKASIPANAIIPMPDWTFDVTLKDADAMKSILASIRPRLNEISNGIATPGDITVEGHPEAFSIAFAPVPVPYVPAIGIDGDRLVCASSVGMLRRALADAKAQRPAGDFARSGNSTFGSGGPDVCFLLYVDLAAAAQSANRILSVGGKALANEMHVPLKLEQLPIDVLLEHLSGALSTVRLSKQAIVLDEASPFGSQFALYAAAIALAENQHSTTASLIDLTEAVPPDPVGVPPQDGDAFMGVQTAPGPESSDGVRVAGVTAGAPAATAGLLAGDRLLAIDDHKIRAQPDIVRLLAMRQPGESVIVAYSRDGEVREVTVTLVKRGEFVNADGTKRQRP